MDFCMIFRKIGTAAVMTAVLFTSASAAEIGQVRDGIQGVYNRKKNGGTSVLDTLSPGESNSDWLAYAIGEYGIEDNYQGYLERLSALVAEKYASQGGLDKNKATEWHRIALAVKALGGDPTSFGGVNLVKDGITEPLVKPQRQGINGLIWAAIAAQECGAEFSGELTLEDICNDIVGRQNPDGGFSLRGDSDPDVTAMAIRALYGVPGFRPYAELARAALLNMQLPSGGYASYGVENCESTAQVIMALCAMGERPDAEVDVLLTYLNPDGGFAHVPGGDSDDMASVQAMMALISYERSLSVETAPEAVSSSGIQSGQPTAAQPSEVQTTEILTTDIQPTEEQAANTPDEPEEQPEAEVLPTEAIPAEDDSVEELPAAVADDETEVNDEKSDVTAVLSVIGASALAAAAYLLAKRKNSK